MQSILNRIEKLLGLTSKEKEFTCAECGEIHYGFPVLSRTTPDHYEYLSEEEKIAIAELDKDFCTITYPEETDRFIRVVMNLETDDHRNLEYGLWVSLSESSFTDYRENFDNPLHEAVYFGWICNNLDGYESTIGIPADVITQKYGLRPYINPHSDFNHPLVFDFYNGITAKEAESRVNAVIG